MPNFVNLNRHRAYVDDPEVGLVRILPREEVEATGKYADNLEATPGVFKVGSKEAKERIEELDAQDQNLENFGPNAYPAVGPDSSGPSPSEKGEKAEGDLLTDDQREERAGQSSGGTATTEDVKPAPKRRTRKTSSKSS